MPLRILSPAKLGIFLHRMRQCAVQGTSQLRSWGLSSQAASGGYQGPTGVSGCLWGWLPPKRDRLVSAASRRQSCLQSSGPVSSHIPEYSSHWELPLSLTCLQLSLVDITGTALSRCPPLQRFLLNLVAFPGSHPATADLRDTSSSPRDIKFFKFHEHRLPDKGDRVYLFPLWKKRGLSQGSHFFHSHSLLQVPSPRTPALLGALGISGYGSWPFPPSTSPKLARSSPGSQES